jgi:multiple sugar transport system substrate-binding protein
MPDRSPVPPYFQLKTMLLDAIAAGEYAPGDRLPTELELCRRYSLSRTPVTRALTELADEGIVLRRRRRGTFVNPEWAPQRAAPTEVRVVVGEGPWAEMVAAAAPDGVAASVVAVPRPDLHRTLRHAVAEGRAPDLALLDSVWIAEFAHLGFVLPLDELDPDWVRREHEHDFLPAVVAANRFGGRTFGVSAFADVAGLWYRRDALEAVGAAPPATWAELRAAAEALVSAGVPSPIAMLGGTAGAETTSYCLVALLASNGAVAIDAGRVTVGSAAAADALRFARGLVADGLMPAACVGYAWDRPIRLLAGGGAAIAFGGSYEARTLAQALAVPLAEVFERFGFAPVPAGPRGAPAATAGTMAYTIPRQAAQPRHALRLLRELVAPGRVADVARATGRIPARRSAVALAEPAPTFVAQTAEMLEHAVNRPPTPVYPRVSAQLQEMLESVLTGDADPEAAARRAADLIAAITGLPVA